MTTTTQDQLTLENFRKQTGYRFRVTNEQQARIFLTSLSDEKRAFLHNAVAHVVAQLAEKTNKNGNPFKWMELVGEMAVNWNDSMALTREQAFQAFLEDGGPDRLKNRKPDVPISVYQDPTLTLENFSAKVEAATGAKRRFRLPRNLAKRVEAKEITREQGFQETVKRILDNE